MFTVQWAVQAINADDRIRHFNHLITLGFVFYLPTEAAVTD